MKHKPVKLNLEPKNQVTWDVSYAIRLGIQYELEPVLRDQFCGEQLNWASMGSQTAIFKEIYFGGEGDMPDKIFMSKTSFDELKKALNEKT